MTWQRAVFLAAAVLFFFQLGGHDLWAPDEPYFAEGAREMVVDGQWAVPHVNGVVTSDKPPLFFWLIALFSLPLGNVSSWTARLPSALAALGTVALTMRLGARFFGPRSAALAGAVLATSYLFWEKARWSQTDALLCFLIWVALAAFATFRAGDAAERSRGTAAGVLFWLAAALAVLVKGPVGFLLPLGIALVTLATDRDLGRWRRFAPVWGPLVFAGVLGAWIALVTLAGPAEYSVWGALRDHFINRGIHGMHHRQPPWYFLEVLPAMLMPWTALVPGALVLAWRRRQAADRFLLVAALFVVAFFSISTEKRELYSLPAFPAFALLVAALVAAVCGWNEPAAAQGESPAPNRRWVTVGQGILGGLLVAVAIALPIAGRRFDEVPSGVLLTLAVVLGAAGVAALVFARRGRILAAALAPAAGMALAYLIAVAAVYPAMEPSKSARPFALRIAALTADSRAAGRPVVAYDVGNLPKAFAFYGDGLYTLDTADPAVLREHLERPDPVFAVIPGGGGVEALPADLAGRLFVVDSTVLSRREVLLVTNRPGPDTRPLLAAPPAD